MVFLKVIHKYSSMNLDPEYYEIDLNLWAYGGGSVDSNAGIEIAIYNWKVERFEDKYNSDLYRGSDIIVVDSPPQEWLKRRIEHAVSEIGRLEKQMDRYKKLLKE